MKKRYDGLFSLCVFLPVCFLLCAIIWFYSRPWFVLSAVVSLAAAVIKWWRPANSIQGITNKRVSG